MAATGISTEILNTVFSTAQSGSPAFWTTLGINLILTTLVGGIVILLLMEAIAKKEGESVSVKNAFLMVLLISLINYVGVIGLLLPYLPLPFAGLVITLLIWIILTKLFFSHIHILHAIIAGIVGFVLSLFVIPYIVSLVAGFIPL